MKESLSKVIKLILLSCRTLLFAVVVINPLGINFDLSSSRPIPKAIHGANQNWFTLFPITHNLIKEAINKLGFTQIRFPGGTVSNYYDWVKFAPDWQAIETLPDVPEHVKNSRSSFESQVVSLRPSMFYKTLEGIDKEMTFVANVYLNTPEEITGSLQRLKDNGVIVKRLEMGNEMYFSRYNLTVGEYMSRAHETNQAAKKIFPEVKTALVVDRDLWLVGREDFDWDIPNRDWYDAIIIHAYTLSHIDLWQQNKQDYITWLTNSRREEFGKFIDRVKKKYPNKELWLTEWNFIEPNELLFTNSYAQAYYVYDFLLDILRYPEIAVANHAPMIGGNVYGGIFSPRQEFVNEYFTFFPSFPPKMVPVGDDRGIYTFDWFFVKHASFWPLAWIGQAFGKYQDLAVGTILQTPDCYSGEDVAAIYFFNKSDPIRGSYAMINKTGNPIKIVLSGTISLKRQFKLAILKKPWDQHSLEGAEFKPVESNVTSDEIVLPAYSLAYLAFINTIPPIDCGTPIGCNRE